MLYHVSRNGTNYGPYTLEDLQRYVASGNVLPTDMAKSDEMAEWSTVAQVLGQAPAAASTGMASAPSAYPGAQPYGVVPYPDPPNLHWGLVLLIGIFTCGIFIIVWDIVQAVWMRKVNLRSNALVLYVVGDVLNFGGTIARFSLMAAMRHNAMLGTGLGGLVSIGAAVLIIMARFDMRRSMEEHFNGPEPVGLSLSGVMTFFFGSLYFQYHFTRINEVKRIARYRGAQI